MTKHLLHLTCIALIILASSCGENSDPLQDKDTFTRIFDSNQFSSSFTPVDIKQTADGGYLILSERKLADTITFSGIYVLKTDAFGNFVKGLEVDAMYVNPVGELMSFNNNYYFFCMEGAQAIAGTVHLAKIDTDLNLEIINTSGNLSYPAAAALDNQDFLLLSYDNTNRQSVVSTITTDGTITNTRQFDIEPSDEIEEPIMNHFTRTGRKFPMTVGRTPDNLYYFNGFINYSFSLVFFNTFSDDNEPGVIQGQSNDGGFSAVLAVDDHKFAAARFNFGDNFFLPVAPLSTTGTTSVVDDNLKGNALLELVPDAKVKIIKATINGKNVLIYASNTKLKQIGLYFYDETAGTFIGSHYLGFSNPFEVSSLIQTADNGLVIAGTTYLAGRFPRICLFKLSEKNLSKDINQ